MPAACPGSRSTDGWRPDPGHLPHPVAIFCGSPKHLHKNLHKSLAHVIVHWRALLSSSVVAGGQVLNPIQALAQLATTFHHPNNSIAVEGFYEYAPPCCTPAL